MVFFIEGQETQSLNQSAEGIDNQDTDNDVPSIILDNSQIFSENEEDSQKKDETAQTVSDLTMKFDSLPATNKQFYNLGTITSDEIVTHNEAPAVTQTDNPITKRISGLTARLPSPFKQPKLITHVDQGEWV